MVINREGMDSIGDINLRMLNGNIENLIIQVEHDKSFIPRDQIGTCTSTAHTAIM